MKVFTSSFLYFLLSFCLSAMEPSEQEILHFMNLIALGDKASIEELVRKKPAFLKTVDPVVGMNPLMRAASTGNASLIQFFHEKGIDLDRQNAQGFTALHFAVIGDKAQSVERLLKLRANRNIANQDGLTPNVLAQTRTHPDIKILLQAKEWEYVFRSIPNITNPISGSDAHVKDVRQNILYDCQAIVKRIKALINTPKEIPRNLLEAFGRAFAQMSFLRPDLLHDGYHEIASSLVQQNLLTSTTLNLADYPWQFGLLEEAQFEAQKKDPRTDFYYSSMMHTNIPVYVNGRLPSQFLGDKLIIGAGKNCLCAQTGGSPHPEAEWYSIDILKNSNPDLVMNAELAQHLHFLPSHKFSLIVVERLDVAGFSQTGIVDQYLRILKPNGSIIVFSSTFKDKSQLSEYYEPLYEVQKAVFAGRKFLVSPLALKTSVYSGYYETWWTATAPTGKGGVSLKPGVKNFIFKADNYNSIAGL